MTHDHRIKFVFFLAGLALAFAVTCFVVLEIHNRHAVPKYNPAVDPVSMLAAAQKRDPFACGQGLKWLTPFPNQALTRQYVEACCRPPVEDLAGLVAPACKKLEH